VHADILVVVFDDVLSSRLGGHGFGPQLELLVDVVLLTVAWAPSFRALLALERQYLVQCGTSRTSSSRRWPGRRESFFQELIRFALNPCELGGIE
jgi:hypothetical protein